MDVHRNRDPNLFCVKWSLFTITLAMFVGSICLAEFHGKIADVYDNNKSLKSEKPICFVMAIGLYSALFSLSGLYGSYEEHYYSTVTFFVYMTMNTIGNVKAAFQTSSLVPSAAISLCITCCAFIFASQLKIKPILSVSNTVGPQQGQTVIIPMVRNYCSDPYNPSAQQQLSPPQPPPRYAQ